MLGRSALLARTTAKYGNWLGNYSNVSLLLRGGTPQLIIQDESPAPKTITAVGNATFTTAVAKWNQGSGGSSLAFDGSGDYLSISSSADFAFAGDFTVEAWGYLSSAPSGTNANYMTDFRNASAGNAGFTFGVLGSSGNARMYQFASTPGVDVLGSSIVPLNIWNHFAYVRSGSTVTMYLNGVSQGSLTSSFSQATTPLIVGARFNTLTEYWHGYIDDLRITKGVARYVQGTGANAGKMVFAGTNTLADPNNFGELPANVINDSSYNSVSLLLRGGTPSQTLILQDESPAPKTITAVGNATFTTAVAKWNQGSGGSSLAFDGNGDYLTAEIDSSFEFGAGDFTVECWVRFNSLSVEQRFAGIGRGAIGGDNPVYTGWSLRYAAGNLRFYRFDGTETIVNRSWAPVVNTWYHIAVSRSGTSLRLFVDGVQLGPAETNSTSYNRVNNEDFEIGRVITGDGTFFLNVYIDDLRITKGIARYTSNFAPPPAELPNF